MTRCFSNWVFSSNGHNRITIRVKKASLFHAFLEAQSLTLCCIFCFIIVIFPFYGDHLEGKRFNWTLNVWKFQFGIFDYAKILEELQTVGEKNKKRLNPWAKKVSSIGLPGTKRQAIVITMVWRPNGLPYRRTLGQRSWPRWKSRLEIEKIPAHLMSWFKHFKIFKSHCVFRKLTGRRLSSQSMCWMEKSPFRCASFDQWRFFGHGLAF